MFARLLTIALQIIATYFAAAISFIAVPIGNGWELPWLVIVCSLAIWGAGWACSKFLSVSTPTRMHLMMAMVVAGIGVAIILLTPAIGFIQILYPGIGALIGYYLTNLVVRNS